MRVAFFSTKRYDRISFESANTNLGHEFTFFEPRLTSQTAALAAGFPCVCVFINDVLDAEVLRILAANGTKLIALRSAGFNHVDLEVAGELGLHVVRVPAYSPYAVAEHAAGLVLMLNRKLYRAYNRVREDNFSLDGLLGFDLNGSTVGVIGTGKIGQIFARIMHGFGCHLLGYDAYPTDAFSSIGDARYVDLPELLANSDIISLHCPLLPSTHHIIRAETIAQMKPGMMLINTSRGALVNTRDVIDGIKSGQIGYLGTDVYEEEAELFFEDLSDTVIKDDTFQLLQSYSNVVITAHQAFFTRNAVEAIANTTLQNVTDIEQGRSCANEVKAEMIPVPISASKG
ncbi:MULTISPECIES: 2-hydroxyacid dehydrogenase [unclassified Leptolyngbya]|uniref:2-hydroxyacid dehydrogenase n=1 Tax=unclassified Leptolyngbya TaxID=2650499 RepID=UPI00168380B8|nr:MULTISPECIES: 2-hydroxyacid dehydrogenase [unclassified Leptolyngbya]MBD1913897.1 2-hydroxyacid dehydrogenase [Leptolyngbya sp. FACHB-8]MBD2156349.1 2-hydroxyacid dehydrogenase [Leptolyngbya sp. FACHB-16]